MKHARDITWTKDDILEKVKRERFYREARLIDETILVHLENGVAWEKNNYSLNDMCSFSKPNKLNECCVRRDPLTSNHVLEELKRVFNEIEDCLVHPNVCLAGGSICHALGMSKKFQTDVHDLDIFIYGINDKEAATNLVFELANKIVEKLKKKHDYDHSVLSSHTLTVFNDYPTHPYQFIFRLYRSVDEILLGFDLPCSAMGLCFRESNEEPGKLKPVVFLSPLAELALTSGICVVLPERASPSFVSRQAKYFDRHNIVMVYPGMNFRKIYGKKIIKLGNTPNSKCYLQIKVKSLYYSKIVGELTIMNNLKNKHEKDVDLISFHDYIHICGVWDKRADIFNYNRRCLVTGNLDYILYIAQEEKGPLALGNFEIGISWNSIEKKFERLKKKLMHYRNARPSDIDMATLILYFSLDTAEMVTALTTNNKKRIKQMCSLKLETMRERFRLAKNNLPKTIKWVTENPGSQHSSSFHPEYFTDKQWFGEYSI